MSENTKHKGRVHPITAFFAVAGFSLMGGLTLVTLAQAETTTPPKPTPCQEACYRAFGECNKAAGDSQDAHNQCKTDGNGCMAKCPARTDGQPTSGTDKPKLSECAQACYVAKSECVKAAGDNADAIHACMETGTACANKCAPATTVGADKTYQDAVQAAKQHFLDGQKKLLDEYQAALEKAWMAKMKAMSTTAKK